MERDQSAHWRPGGERRGRKHVIQAQPLRRYGRRAWWIAHTGPQSAVNGEFPVPPQIAETAASICQRSIAGVRHRGSHVHRTTGGIAVPRYGVIDDLAGERGKPTAGNDSLIDSKSAPSRLSPTWGRYATAWSMASTSRKRSPNLGISSACALSIARSPRNPSRVWPRRFLEGPVQSWPFACRWEHRPANRNGP